MPTKKRKAQRAGLKQGRYNGAKKLKANKENFTVYITKLPSDPKDGPDQTFSSLPVHGTHSIPTGRRNGPDASSLHPSSSANDDDILPDLEPVSDNEDERDEDIHADDATTIQTTIGTTPQAPAAAAADDYEMPFADENSQSNREPSNQQTWPDSLTSAHPHDTSLNPDPFLNPRQQPGSSNDRAPPADAWRFNYSGDCDDEYLEEYGTDDFAEGSIPDEDVQHESMDEEAEEGHPEDDAKEGKFTAPTIEEAQAALKAINLLLRPPRNTGAGYKRCDLPLYTRTRLEWVASFLHLYTSNHHRVPGQQPVNSKWISASLAAAHAAQKGPWTARRLRQWVRAFMKDPKDLPTSPYSSWNRERSILEDADVANEIALHLQSLGKYVKALDIVHYIDQPDVKKRLGLKKGIHLATAQRWMKRMGYRWTKNPAGQYVDRHEQPDVVYYRQTEFIPAFTQLEHQMRKWLLQNKRAHLRAAAESDYRNLVSR
ncbi:hypothetical protein MVEN_00839800 [Mycena venus]|uniref:Uncharacterized protein n=1 Tax=Mycena venus TaxID=2733690 RepID=A0A8H6YBE5_9AGAR|nr:hypothetical protein MVEN_00839800 [Mycena venus]